MRSCDPSRRDVPVPGAADRQRAASRGRFGVAVRVMEQTARERARLGAVRGPRRRLVRQATATPTGQRHFGGTVPKTDHSHDVYFTWSGLAVVARTLPLTSAPDADARRRPYGPADAEALVSRPEEPHESGTGVRNSANQDPHARSPPVSDLVWTFQRLTNLIMTGSSRGQPELDRGVTWNTPIRPSRQPVMSDRSLKTAPHWTYAPTDRDPTNT